MTLPPIPKDRNWSPETWRAGLDEAVRLSGLQYSGWEDFSLIYAINSAVSQSIIAHATTLIEAGIVKPVVSEAAVLLKASHEARKGTIDMLPIWECPAAIAVIQSALDKARAGE